MGGNRKLEREEGDWSNENSGPLSSLDSWWLRNYLSGRKRKSDQISTADGGGDSGGGGGPSCGGAAESMEVDA